MLHVTSRHNPHIAAARKLAQSSRERRKAQRCVLEGEHLIAVYRERVGPPETLIIVDDALANPRIAALGSNVPAARVLLVSRALFSEIVASSPDVGVLAVVPTPRPLPQEAADFCLLLEDLQDPGNIGTILRTAAAAGVAQVLLSKRCAFAWSPKVLRAAQGAHFLTTVVEDVDLPAWAMTFRARNGQVAALVPRGGVPLVDATLQRPLALAVGNEGAGLSAPLVAAADRRLTIPLPGGMESLNAAAAAAVALFECIRQWRPTDRRGSVQDR
jgi:TrmH family RNA methyltransferase